MAPKDSMVKIFSDPRYRIKRKEIKQATEQYLKEQGMTDEHVFNVVFVGRIKMKQIAKTYKQENVALPVLSFSYLESNDPSPEEKTAGEIFVCYPQAVLLAAERERKVNDIIIQLIRHGIENII